MGDAPEHAKNNSPEDGSGQVNQDELILQQQRQIEREVKSVVNKKVGLCYNNFFCRFPKVFH